MSMSPIAVARAVYAAIEAGKHGEELRALFVPDAVTIERPNVLKPAGSRAELEDILKAATAGASLLARQSYEILSAIEHGSLAVVRLIWTGEIARDVGSFREGQVLKAHIAQFIETRDGRVASIETYDCYEPFAPG